MCFDYALRTFISSVFSRRMKVMIKRSLGRR